MLGEGGVKLLFCYVGVVGVILAKDEEGEVDSTSRQTAKKCGVCRYLVYFHNLHFQEVIGG